MSDFNGQQLIDNTIALKLFKTDLEDSDPLCSEFGRKFVEFFNDRVPYSLHRYWISIDTYTRLISEANKTELSSSEKFGSVFVHSNLNLLKSGNFCDIFTLDGKRFHLNVSKVMNMYPEGAIFVETLDLEKTIHDNRKDLHIIVSE